MEKTTPPRLAALDVLRAIAVLLVLGRHMPDQAVGHVPGWAGDFLATWMRGGWIGVDLFFVLSGFLISGVLFREHQRFGVIRCGQFLARRAFKIYPAFYVMFGVVLIYGMWLGRKFVGWPVVFSEALFFQNYGPALFPHTWSLAVEEHFYLVLPFLLAALSKRGSQPFARLPFVFFFVAGAALLIRLADGGELFRYKTHLFATHLRADSLMFGVLLGYLHHFRGETLAAWVRRWRWVLAVVTVAAFAPAFVLEIGTDWYLHTLGLTVLYLGSGALLLLALHFPLRSRMLAAIGACSYSIYLWHMPIRFFGLAWLPAETPPFLRIAAFFGCTIGAGIVLTHLIETPFLRLRDRLFPRRSRPLVAPASAMNDEAPRQLDLPLGLEVRV